MFPESREATVFREKTPEGRPMIWQCQPYPIGDNSKE